MPPRRSHKKSRAGCRRCKARKIKCDEVHPRCGNCVKHGVRCDFEHPEITVDYQSASASTSANAPSIDSPTAVTPSVAAAASPRSDIRSPSTLHAPSPTISVSTPLCRSPSSPSLSQTPPSGRLMELRLMHQYTSMTCKTLTVTAPVTEEIWRDTVPRLAFCGSQHLTDAVLAVAALHLRSLCPNDAEVARASHAYMARSLAEYSATLNRGIHGSNAEALFLTATLIAFQSTATRVFLKDDASIERSRSPSHLGMHGRESDYSLPLSWFHSFQGVKAVVAASWPFLRTSGIVIPIINSQPPLNLDFNSSAEATFFGHLLSDLDEELELQDSGPAVPATPTVFPDLAAPADSNREATRQAYQHAVAVLNWAHKIPHKGAPLAFPATVSKRFVELLEERRPRALAVLACFFALLRSLDSVWWLHGIARREVLGVASLFNPASRWWPSLQWAMRIALWEPPAGAAHAAGPSAGETPVGIPADVWGADWLAEESALAETQPSFTSHIEMISRMMSPVQHLPSGPSSAPPAPPTMPVTTDA